MQGLYDLMSPQLLLGALGLIGGWFLFKCNEPVHSYAATTTSSSSSSSTGGKAHHNSQRITSKANTSAKNPVHHTITSHPKTTTTTNHVHHNTTTRHNIIYQHQLAGDMESVMEDRRDAAKHASAASLHHVHHNANTRHNITKNYTQDAKFFPNHKPFTRYDYSPNSFTKTHNENDELRMRLQGLGGDVAGGSFTHQGIMHSSPGTAIKPPSDFHDPILHMTDQDNPHRHQMINDPDLHNSHPVDLGPNVWVNL
jgi:hypothetical protein